MDIGSGTFLYCVSWYRVNIGDVKTSATGEIPGSDDRRADTHSEVSYVRGGLSLRGFLNHYVNQSKPLSIQK